MPTVLVCDDHPVARAALRVFLARDPSVEVVGEAADGREAVALADRLRPDVVLMDLRMPVVDGIAATRAITALPEPAPKVVVVTTYDTDEYVREALLAGASGFLLKDAEPAEVPRAVRVVAAGDALLAPSVTRRLLGEFTASSRASAPPAPGVETLTAREREVLSLVARGMSNAEIAGALQVGPETVKTYLSRIFRKLGVRDRVQAVILAYRAGLVDG